MANQRRHVRSGGGRLRALLLIAALLGSVFVGFIVWSALFSEDGAPSRAGTKPPLASNNGTGQEPAKGGKSPVPDDKEGLDPNTDPEEEATEAETQKVYDLVISNGRVINPETTLDKEGMNVGISGGTIEVVTSKKLTGTREIDASGLVVAPGFIDNLSYDPNPLGVWNKIADGVTTNIAMHGGSSTPGSWYTHYEGDKPPVHFGASFFYTQARNQFKLGRYDAAKPEQTAKLKEQAEKALNNGALGISFSLEYVPGISPEEVLPLMELAREYNVPVYFHGRYSDMEEPGTNIDTMNEIIGYARASGAAVHIDHIHSTGGTFSMGQSLAMLEDGLAEGLDITACIYPYNYWGTYLNSARFDKGWQERFRISYEDLQIAGTTERLTAESFVKYQKEGKLAVAYAIPEQDVIDALKKPYVMIGSDAILEPGHNNHPRASGTFARTIGLYARDKGAISLMDAIAKQSLQPAQRLEKQAIALQKKGRIAKGMDADLVIFNYDTINDRSTVEKPELFSAGIEYVLVEGQLALEKGELNKQVRLGKPIRTEFVRFSATSGTAKWEDSSYPVINYREKLYVDAAAMSEHGYALTWDKVSRQWNAEQGEAGSTAIGSPSTGPAANELMLERGYKLHVDNENTDLLSIGDRAYVQVEFLKALGHALEVTRN
ncbi:aminoacylase [Paenibacillaceae bacterium]|nr:aminoacylase [Paenibacillaceae bacterium]